MTNKMTATLELNNGISVNTGLRYYKKLGKDISKEKTRDLSIIHNGKFVKIGKIKNIKIETFTPEKLVLSMDVKTHFKLSTEGKELKFGFLYEPPKRNNEILKFKDITYSCFYLVDIELENALRVTKQRGLTINKDNHEITDSWLSLEEIIFSS